MQKITRSLIIAGIVATPALVMSAAAKADEAKSPISANVSLVSDYQYRGISQTDARPAIQGGFDYAHSSGFYLGTWASSVSWLTDAGSGGNAGNSNSMEWDFYGGFKGDIAKTGLGYDVGVLHYYYPGSYVPAQTNPDTTELYVAGSYSFFTAKYSYSLTNLFGAADSKGSGYLDLAANFDLGQGFGLGAHVGRQTIKNGTDYTDWKLGVTKDLAGVTLGLAYTDTNISPDFVSVKSGKNLTDGRFILSVSKSF